ncbi:TPA_asm: L [Cuscuta gammacytorhabdovirus 1]|nr:TPA_asm: L [Cuscuta gammacytorhabdovirus 1]
MEETRRSSYKGLRDYHLRSALCSYTLTSDDPTTHKITNAQIAMFKSNYSIVEKDPIQTLGMILTRAQEVETYSPEIHLAGQLLRVESGIFPSMPQEDIDRIGKFLTSNTLKTKFYGLSQFFQNAIVCANALAAGKDLPRHIFQSTVDKAFGVVTMRNPVIGLTLIIASECFGATENGVQLSVYHLDHLRNWADKATERFNIELSCILGNPVNPLIYPEISVVHTFWLTWDEMLLEVGNDSYQMIKIFESMCIGILLERHPNENIESGLDFLSVTINDFLDASANQERDRKYLHAMRTLLTQLPDQIISQFYGLYRSWGHPIVDPEKGMEKVMRLATKEKSISGLLPGILRRVFMFKYSTWYKTTKGQYPRISQVDTGDNPILEVFNGEGPTQLLEQYKVSEHWDSLQFEKNIEVPLTFNLAEMVADKAVSPDKAGLIELVRRGKGMYDPTMRRGVLQWLSREPVHCESFLKSINENSLPDNDLTIGLYQKEREVNKTPRMFALMSHHIRCYTVVTESMIAEDILPAFPSITMTNDLLSLSKKIYSVSHRLAENSSAQKLDISRDISIIVNIDFEKWNLNFRKETTSGVFSAMGDLYGMPELFNRTYDIFRSSYIYLGDGSYTPAVNGRDLQPDPPKAYTGHLGGLEGLRQKGWTVFTACGLELVCSRHNCQYSIMGQGDNQVLILTFKTYHLNPDKSVSERGKTLLSQRFKLFMADLTQTFDSLGLPIKALETWSSEHLFLYGKVPTLRGVPLCMSLKKICRAYYLANEEIMTLECSVATVQSNAMAACMSDLTSSIPYAVYKVQIVLALKAYYDYHVLLGKGAFDNAYDGKWDFTTSSGQRSRYQIDTQLPKTDLLAVLSWFPKILGGISTCCWPDFMMRGFPDKVSSALYTTHELIRCCNKESIRHALKLIYGAHINPEKNWTLLIEDPCALNLVVPVDARASVKQSVQELFDNLPTVKNTQFSSLFKFNAGWDREEFCRLLCGGEILHPRFLHDVVASTVGGYVDSIVSKISKSSTIGKLALSSSMSNPGKKIEKHEQNYMNYLVWKTSPSNKISTGEMHRCPTLQSIALRLRSWDKILEGITVPFPLSFLRYSNCTAGRREFDECDGNYILAAVPERLMIPTPDKIITLGKAPPYLGSITKEKIGHDSVRQVFGREPLITRPLSLLRVVNWFVPYNSIASKLIFRLLSSVSDLDPEKYVSREMGVTGSEAHRYRDQALKHGVMSANLYTMGSHMHISTDPWVKYTRGAENYTINYQAVLCSIQSLVGQSLLNYAQKGVLPPREYHFHESCESCIAPLTEEFHDFLNEEMLTKIPTDPNNQYLWVSEESIITKYKLDPLLNSDIHEISVAEYTQRCDHRKILTEWLADDIIEDLYNGNAQESVSRLLTTRDYPRVMYKKLGYSETMNTLASKLVYHVGVLYSSGQSDRVVNLKQGRELAVDDIMKTSPLQVQGLIGFFSWPEKFQEVYLDSKTSLFPDTNPPTVMSSCRAMKGNLRDRIKSTNLIRPGELVIRRHDKNPTLRIKNFWYAVTATSETPCPQCLSEIGRLELITRISDYYNLRCAMQHLVISEQHKNIRVLTASEDKLLKDSIPWREEIVASQDNSLQVARCPATVLLCHQVLGETMEITDKDFCIVKANNYWRPVITLPTNSFHRVHETLSVIHFELGIKDLGAECLILGDGLGESSHLLSLYSPSTMFTAASLQDSELAIPHSYAHDLIPENPLPAQNINYSLSRCLFNDYLNYDVAKRWAEWVDYDVCWCEIELSDDNYALLNNILSAKKMKMMIWRCEASTLESLEEILNFCALRCTSVDTYLLQSFNVNSLEVLIILRDTRDIPVCNNQTQFVMADEQFHLLFELGESLAYGEYLGRLEGKIGVSRMIKRCDMWFAEVGMTHLLGCGKYFTPIWWDLQTGRLPKSVENLGENRRYYLYKSDEVALTARLIALAISLLEDPVIREEELAKYQHWKLRIGKRDSKLTITIRRVRDPQDYGIDHILIPKYVPILRELNKLYGRKIRFLPQSISFDTGSNNPCFAIGPSAWQIPSSFPEVLY